MSYISPIKIGYEAEPEEGWTDKIGKYIAGEVDNLVLESCVKVGCHVDKDELEKALRYDRDQYVKGYEDGKRDAAAAIEDMAKHITEMHERVTVLQIARGKLEEEVDALKHDIARAIQNNVNLLSEFQQISAENMMLKAKMEVQDGKEN